MSEAALPPAGLYRTLFAHPTQPNNIGARALVYFSPSSDQGPPAVIRPERREGRAWKFGQQGVQASDPAWLNYLVPLPPQGYYLLSQEVIYGVGQKLPAHLLVFLSYDAQANAVVFPGVGLPDQNIAFGNDAIALSDLQLEYCVPVTFGLAQARVEPSSVH